MTALHFKLMIPTDLSLVPWYMWQSGETYQPQLQRDDTTTFKIMTDVHGFGVFGNAALLRGNLDAIKIPLPHLNDVQTKRVSSPEFFQTL